LKGAGTKTPIKVQISHKTPLAKYDTSGYDAFTPQADLYVHIQLYKETDVGQTHGAKLMAKFKCSRRHNVISFCSLRGVLFSWQVIGNSFAYTVPACINRPPLSPSASSPTKVGVAAFLGKEFALSTAIIALH